MSTSVPAWLRVWREGFAPSLPTAGLMALADALGRNEPTVLQGATTSPPPLQCVQDWPCEAADPVAYTFWRGCNTITTVGDVEAAWAGACYHADQVLGELTACRYFLNWWDETPRLVACAALLEEVRAELFARCGAYATA